MAFECPCRVSAVSAGGRDGDVKFQVGEDATLVSAITLQNTN